MELGRKVMTIAQILELDPESVIRIARSAGDNIDILVGGTLIGYGEIVIIEDAVGVRITDFGSGGMTGTWISSGNRWQSHSSSPYLVPALWLLQRKGKIRLGAEKPASAAHPRIAGEAGPQRSTIPFTWFGSAAAKWCWRCIRPVSPWCAISAGRSREATP